MANVSVMDITTDSVLLQWTYQSNGSSPRTSVGIEVRRSGTLQRTEMVGSQFTTAEISSLLPLTMYNFSIFVVSSIGRSNPSSVSDQTLSLSTKMAKLFL